MNDVAEDIANDPRTLLYREVDGQAIVVVQMIYNARICVGPVGLPYYDDGWCYPSRHRAVEAAEGWDGQGDPPDGWIKQISTGRRRTDGDPEKEYVQR